MSVATVEDILIEEGAPRVRFATRERRGALLGLSFGQLAVIGFVAAVLLGTLLIGLSVFWMALVPCIVIFALGVGRYRREPVLLIIWQAIRYGRRALTGQTRFRRDVWMRVAAASLKVGTARIQAATPVVASKFLLPGALGDVHVVQIPGAGAYIYNAKGSLATVTISVQSQAWSLRDKGTQEGAYEGFVEWLSSLESMPGLVEAVTRIRIDRASTTEMLDYLQAREDEFAPQVTNQLRREYFQLITASSKRSMGFSNHVTLVFSTQKLNAAIRDSGGGMLGLASVLKERIAGLEHSMEHARVRLDSWLDAAALNTMMAAATDPVAAAHRREGESARRDALHVNPAIMGVDEQWDALRIDESWHQTFWISEWPRTEVSTGFLEPLLYAGDATRVITLQVRPVPIHKALSQVNRAQADMETAADIRLRLQARTTRAHDREAEDLAERERDLVDGFGDVQFRGFVTISAESKDALAKARTDLEAAAQPARVNLVAMYGQQAAAFVTAVLPVAVEGH